MSDLKTKLKIFDFTLKGRAGIDLLELIQEYQRLQNKKKIVDSGLSAENLDIDSLSEEEREEIIKASQTINDIEKQIKEAKKQGRDVEVLEKKVNKLKTEAGTKLLNNNSNIINNVLSYSISEEEKEFKRNLREVRNEIFVYLPKALKFDAILLDDLNTADINELIQSIVDENDVNLNNFF